MALPLWGPKQVSHFLELAFLNISLFTSNQSLVLHYYKGIEMQDFSWTVELMDPFMDLGCLHS